MTYAKSMELTSEQMARMGEKANTLTRLLKYRDIYPKDPVKWIHDRLGIPREQMQWSLLPQYKSHKWDGDKDPLIKLSYAIADSQWVAIEGGTGTSKTFHMACMALWFLECFINSLVIITTPKERQLALHIWREIEKLLPRFGRGDSTKLMLRMKQKSDEWIMIGFVAGVRAEEVDASATKAQGFHSEHMMIILDEATGISDAIYTAFKNTCVAPHNIVVALGNPDHQLDPLHKFSCLPNVIPIRLSGYDYPNVVLKNPNFIKGGQTEKGLERMLQSYKSETNPLYLSRARGISPEQSTDAMIRLEWIRLAQQRTPKTESGIIAFGVDVANSAEGDKAAIARGYDSVLTHLDDFPCPNANKLGEQIWQMMEQFKVVQEYVGVDGVGVGAGTVNELKRLGKQITDIQSGAAAIELMKDGQKLSEEFNNLRSQMWWQARLDLQDERGELVIQVEDDELAADLITPHYRIRGNKIIVESKDEIRKRLGRSPNKGDAFVYWNWVRSHRSVRPAMLMDGMKELNPQGELVEVEDYTKYYNAERRRRW